MNGPKRNARESIHAEAIRASKQVKAGTGGCQRYLGKWHRVAVAVAHDSGDRSAEQHQVQYRRLRDVSQRHVDVATIPVFGILGTERECAQRQTHDFEPSIRIRGGQEGGHIAKRISLGNDNSRERHNRAVRIAYRALSLRKEAASNQW